MKKKMVVVEFESAQEFLRKVKYLRRNTLYVIREKRNLPYFYTRDEMAKEIKALEHLLNCQRYLRISSQPAIVFEKVGKR